MATLFDSRNGLYDHYSSVTCSSVATAGNSLDMRPFTRGSIEATSTSGTPTLTFYASATTTGPFRLLKTSTGGAVSIAVVANGRVSFPAAVANAGHIKLVTSGAAISSLKALLKR